MLYISHVVETTEEEEEEEEDPCFSFSNSPRHGKVGPFFLFPPLITQSSDQTCVFAYSRATQDVNDQSFFSNPRSWL